VEGQQGRFQESERFNSASTGRQVRLFVEDVTYVTQKNHL